MQISVDYREKRSGVIEYLQKPGINVEVTSLKTGDYQIDKRIVFERKTLLDFCESIKDGRLFQQAEKMVLSPMKPAMIIEGATKDLASSKMSRESMQGALINLSLFWGIPVFRALDACETARLMIYAGRQLEWIAKGGIKRSGYRPKTKKKRQLYILQGLPGVGPERAEKILTHFGTVANVAHASVTELEALEGVGAKTAQAIYDAVHETRLEYGSLPTQEIMIRPLPGAE